jgi:hypothetical protein
MHNSSRNDVAVHNVPDYPIDKDAPSADVKLYRVRVGVKDRGNIKSLGDIQRVTPL